jgi:hypothetical protein
MRNSADSCHLLTQAYALYRTRLPIAITHQALLLLTRLKTRYPSARGTSTSPHRLFLSSLMLSSKISMDDTYSNKSWEVVGQGLFSLREVNQMYVLFLLARLYELLLILHLQGTRVVCLPWLERRRPRRGARSVGRRCGRAVPGRARRWSRDHRASQVDGRSQASQGLVFGSPSHSLALDLPFPLARIPSTPSSLRCRRRPPSRRWEPL